MKAKHYKLTTWCVVWDQINFKFFFGLCNSLTIHICVTCACHIFQIHACLCAAYFSLHDIYIVYIIYVQCTLLLWNSIFIFLIFFENCIFVFHLTSVVLTVGDGFFFGFYLFMNFFFLCCHSVWFGLWILHIYLVDVIVVYSLAIDKWKEKQKLRIFI